MLYVRQIMILESQNIDLELILKLSNICKQSFLLSWRIILYFYTFQKELGFGALN